MDGPPGGSGRFAVVAVFEGRGFGADDIGEAMMGGGVFPFADAVEYFQRR